MVEDSGLRVFTYFLAEVHPKTTKIDHTTPNATQQATHSTLDQSASSNSCIHENPAWPSLFRRQKSVTPRYPIRMGLRPRGWYIFNHPTFELRTFLASSGRKSFRPEFVRLFVTLNVGFFLCPHRIASRKGYALFTSWLLKKFLRSPLCWLTVRLRC